MDDGLSRARILLGVTGSIAAYKAAEIARLLVKRGAQVQVAMTQTAQRFIAPLTFQAITSQPVMTDLFAPGSEIAHVETAHAIDLAIVAPLTASTMARIACGLADDALTATLLATRAPVLVAPAMETGMWENAASRENLDKLKARGVAVVGPVAGALASGRSGLGRMAEPEAIVEAAARLLGPRDLEGTGVLITAGPTWEAIDPVRVLSNRSTGTIGIELARAAAGRGANVSLILGPTAIPPPSESERVHTVRVESAEEMLAAGRASLDGASVLIATAAVSDFRPESKSPRKLKRSGSGARTLALAENPDVLATLAAAMRQRAEPGAPLVIVGFAAESEDLEANAREKLKKKGCDLVVANKVGPDAGFGAAATEILVVSANGSKPVPFGPASKSAVAQFVLDQVVGLRKQRAP